MKMRKRFLIVILLLMVLFTSILSVNAFAADSNYSYVVSMTANNTKVAPGNEVSITVKVSNLNVGDDGINSFSAYLAYDTNVFEPLTESSVDGLDGWKPSYTVGTGKIQLYRDKFLKTDGEIMEISLKTKSDVSVGTQGAVKLSTIIVSNSIDEITTPKDVSTSITISSGDSGSSEVIPPVVTNSTPTPLNITPTNNTQQPTDITPTNSIVPINNVTDNEVNNVENQQTNIQVVNESENDMPYTGTDSNALARIIIGVIFIALVMYIKIERMNKDIK